MGSKRTCLFLLRLIFFIHNKFREDLKQLHFLDSILASVARSLCSIHPKVFVRFDFKLLQTEFLLWFWLIRFCPKTSEFCTVGNGVSGTR